MEPTVPALREMLAQVPDPRKARGKRYPWPALLLLLVAALLSGANSQRGVARWGQTTGETWRQRLGVMRRRGPSQATMQRVLAQVDVDALE